MADFRIWSDEFPANGFMTRAQEFDQQAFGGSSDNVSPALQWEGPPAETRSLALTVYDPDAPTGRGFWHWIVVNIPLDVRPLPRNAGKADGSLLKGALQLATTTARSASAERCRHTGRQVASLHLSDSRAECGEPAARRKRDERSGALHDASERDRFGDLHRPVRAEVSLRNGAAPPGLRRRFPATGAQAN